MIKDSECTKCSKNYKCNTQKRIGRENIASMIACVEFKECTFCEECNGDGFTAEHSPYDGNHDQDGSCNGSCPIQVQCEACMGTGKTLIVEVKSDLPF